MSQLGLTSNIVTATGILGCAWWAGAGQSLSIFSVAAALETSAEPIHALKLWQNLFYRGMSIGPKFAGITFLSLAYSAYDRYRHGLAWKPFVVAGALGLGILVGSVHIRTAYIDSNRRNAQHRDLASLVCKSGCDGFLLTCSPLDSGVPKPWLRLHHTRMAQRND
ncbi:hypothetical protein CKAH01_06641 [Colletotrichum kahawae]|uniref:Uncharacterized protein n=1 Tax=Colletotrichum kahawae TaxID=34407 RepID=A0AAD9Y971_COLKA|nr:hypothetical protein CKAH01_06641 [Colletotrichum kahawae]